MENKELTTYCLTKDGYIGILRKVSIEGVTFLPIHKFNMREHIKKVSPDDIYFQDTNLSLVRNKAKQLRREKLNQFLKFQNIVLDISNITYFNFGTFLSHRLNKKISRVLKFNNLSLVHLGNLDSYVILDLSKSKNKNIEIKSTSYGIQHIIGRKGNNISKIKENIGVRNISVTELSYEEFEVIKKDFVNLLNELKLYLTHEIEQYNLIDKEFLCELEKYLKA